MNRWLCLVTAIALVGTLESTAQPPGGGQRGPGGRPSGQRGPGGPGGGNRGGSSNAVLAAIDADGDHTISAREILNAAAALKTLDRNNDGKLTSDEIHSGGGHGDGGRGQRGGFPGGPPGQGGPPRGPGQEGHGEGGPGGPPTAEKFMEHAMTFDVDSDGKLSQAELKKMAAALVEEMSRRGGPGRRGAERGGPGGGRGEDSGIRKRPEIDD